MAADISESIKNWSTTAGSNSPAGGTAIGTNLDDNLRAIQTGVRYESASSSIASASTTDLSTIDARNITVTGTTTITALGTLSDGMSKLLTFSGALTLTHNATSLILPTAANITTAAGDVAEFLSLGSGNWRCTRYHRASGASLAIGGLVQNGSAAAPLGFVGDSDTGPYSAGTNTYGLSTGGTLRFSISTAAVVSTLPLQVPAGSSSVPAISYYGNGSTDAGLWFSGNNVYLQGDGAAATLQVSSQSVIATSNVNGGTSLYVNHTSVTGDPDSIAHFQTYRDADSAFDALKVTCDSDGTPNLIWRVRGDGATFADGAYSGSGADYAEAFLFTGPEPQPGDPVALDGDRVRIAVDGDDIIGVVSERACAIGDAKLLEQGGVPVGLVGKLRVNPGRPRHPAWRLLAGDLYLVK